MELIPKLKPIKVDPCKLLLDPNNPRFITDPTQAVDESKIGDPATIMAVASKMLPSESVDPFRIDELMHSIVKNGWQPIDSIFVKSYPTDGQYVVLEGNRRVTAIQKLLSDDETLPKLKEDLAEIDVMLVQGHADKEVFERQVAYLLGVRHHGSLKTWSPFAQARNIFELFMEHACLSDEDEFQWDLNIGQSVADALSIKVDKDAKSVKERLSVYRAMVSVSRLPSVGEQQIKDHYYSLFGEMLSIRKRNQELAKYFAQDQASFFLSEDSANRLEDLCHFSLNRQDSPIRNPQEWRAFAAILSDEDREKSKENLERVEVKKEYPSVVWAQRREELKKLEWAIWLEKVRALISRIQLGQIDPEDSNTVDTVKRLIEILESIQKQ